jgi:methionyl aminopeptidase
MITIKTEKEIEIMRECGKRLSCVMDEIGDFIAPGISTYEIDTLARERVIANEGVPIFEGYGGPENPYPGAVCTSINSEIVHGIPSKKRILKEGDLVKIDIGMKYQGLITDMARTFPCGKISPMAYKLSKVTRECLDIGIDKLKAGAKLSDYSIAVDSYVRSFGFSTVKELVGHGVGRELHEDPQIPNYKTKARDIVLRSGMTLALEPMINEGTHEIVLEEDGWTFVTRDGKLSCHFEDTVLVKKNGYEILTRVKK